MFWFKLSFGSKMKMDMKQKFKNSNHDIIYMLWFNFIFGLNFFKPVYFLRLFLRMQNGSYGLSGDLKPSFLHSFSRSDVNKRPLTDGWQTYVTLLSV